MRPWSIRVMVLKLNPNSQKFDCFIEECYKKQLKEKKTVKITGYDIWASGSNQ